jgi:hypothetical protein
VVTAIVPGGPAFVYSTAHKRRGDERVEEAVSICEVHGCPMPIRSVRVVYGLRRGLKQSPAYLATRRAEFPHCDDWSNGGCIVREQRSRKDPVCLECVAARDAYLQTQHFFWLESHEQ